MKKIFLILATAAISLSGFAQEYRCEQTIPETYCSVAKYGHHYMKHDGVKEDKDVKLANGNILHSEGVLETKDRFITIKPDQCMLLDRKVQIVVVEPIAGTK